MNTQTSGPQHMGTPQTQSVQFQVQMNVFKGKGKGKKRTAEGSSEGSQPRTQCRWNESMVVNLITIMLDIKISQGKRSDNGCKKYTYKMVADVMNQRGFTVTSDHVQSKMKQMKKEYTAAADTIKQSGFNFDSKMKCITADSDVWERWIEKYPEASSLKMKWLPYYEDLEIIFGKDSASGEGNFVADDYRPESQTIGGENTDGETINLEDIQTQPSGLTTATSVHTFLMPVETPQDDILRKTTPKSKRRKSRFSSEDITPTFEKMASAAIAIAESLEHPSMKKVNEALKALPNMHKKDVIRAVTLLGKDEKLAEIFFGLDAEDRKEWVMEQLGDRS